jgi:hypothetical protein
MNIEVKEVLSPSDIKRFIQFPHKLYKKSKQYVPVLDMDEKSVLTKSPSLEYCKLRMWMSYNSKGEITGRIAAIYNPRSNEYHNEKRLRFGWFDFIEDFDVAKTLAETAEAWGRELGMEQIHGPLSFNTWGRQGMLIEGFENIPPVNCLYNFSYYPQFIEKLGFGKQVDWIQIKLRADGGVDPRLHRINDLLIEKHGLQVLDIKKIKDIDGLVTKFFKSYNQSFRNIDNFVPLTDAEVRQIGKEYFPKLKPELTSIVLDPEGNIAAFGICFPSLSKAFQKAKGKLFPFGIFHIMKALKKYDYIDFMLIGAAPEWQHKGITSIFHTHLGSNLKERGITYGITNPQAETNSAFKVWERYEFEPYMKRRCYIKNI